MLPGPLWRAIVRRSHGGVALSAEHSQGGDTLSCSALRDGEQRQRLKCCRQADNKRRRSETGRHEQMGIKEGQKK